MHNNTVIGYGITTQKSKKPISLSEKFLRSGNNPITHNISMPVRVFFIVGVFFILVKPL